MRLQAWAEIRRWAAFLLGLLRSWDQPFEGGHGLLSVRKLWLLCGLQAVEGKRKPGHRLGDAQSLGHCGGGVEVKRSRWVRCIGGGTDRTGLESGGKEWSRMTGSLIWGFRQK